ncbi:uncharacterized protein LOC114299345 [Camellia sinensis]|uniref:uncharacterized protein LOC114299345 n=1 Tax=Camellia sinensis TaxID=4442 RepID=UPI0010360AF7|nr:uncharacterized protein LOC114299345 [Camellia sinensis]
MSVLINGTPVGFFWTHRGLRQGDPLFPLLFLLVIEALSRLLDKAMREGRLEGFVVGSLAGTLLEVSHLLYADDALIFYGAEVVHVGYLRCVLLCFEMISSLRVNLRKSELILVRTVARLPVMAAVLGCKVSILPVSYLGLPLGASFKAKGVWDGVVERVQRRLASWKCQYLLKGGRLTMFKNVLSSIPTYFMSVHVIPVLVAHWLEKLQRDFLWGSGGDNFQYHLVDWG